MVHTMEWRLIAVIFDNLNSCFSIKLKTLTRNFMLWFPNGEFCSVTSRNRTQGEHCRDASTQPNTYFKNFLALTVPHEKFCCHCGCNNNTPSEYITLGEPPEQIPLPGFHQCRGYELRRTKNVYERNAAIFCHAPRITSLEK